MPTDDDHSRGFSEHRLFATNGWVELQLEGFVGRRHLRGQNPAGREIVVVLRLEEEGAGASRSDAVASDPGGALDVGDEDVTLASMKGKALVVLGVLGVCACGSSDEESDGNAIEATRSDGTWMFFYSPTDHNEALHSGTATIEGDCLMVGGTVVVWHRESQDIADAALTAAKEGSAAVFSIGGGGISLDEGDQTIPEEIAEHCDVRAVWFGSPEARVAESG